MPLGHLELSQASLPCFSSCLLLLTTHRPRGKTRSDKSLPTNSRLISGGVREQVSDEDTAGASTGSSCFLGGSTEVVRAGL